MAAAIMGSTIILTTNEAVHATEVVTPWIVHPQYGDKLFINDIIPYPH